MQKQLNEEEARQFVKTTAKAGALKKENGVAVTEAEVIEASATEIDAMISKIRENASVSCHRKFADVNELKQTIDDFWRFVERERKINHNDLIPDVEAFCSFAGVSRLTVNKWRKNDQYGFGETLDILFNDIASIKNQLAMHGKIPPIVWATMMNNNHGYVQQNKLEVHNTNGTEIMDAKSVIEQASRLPEIAESEEK